MNSFLHSRLSAPLRALALAAAIGTAALAAPIASGQPAMAQGSSAVGTPVTPTPAVPPMATGSKTADSAISANPYGMAALWSGSDIVAKTVLLLLLIMSVGSWYVIVMKLIEQRRMGRQARATTNATGFWEGRSVDAGIDILPAQSPFRFIADAGIGARQKYAKLQQHMPFNHWLSLNVGRAVDRVQSRTQHGLPFLATVGSTSPFVGLFGTVWGIYHALTAIGVAGQASIDKVAGPVGESLIMTAIGLAVAVPAVLGYNWLVRRNKGVMDEVHAFGNELQTFVLSTTGTQPAVQA